MHFQSTYVLRPNGLQTVFIVDKLAKLGAVAVTLEDSARAHEATFAIVKVPGPIRRVKAKGLGRQRHFRIVSSEETLKQDLHDSGMSQLPKWAESAWIKILLQDLPAEFFKDSTNKMSFQNAILEMHRCCVKKIRQADEAARRKKRDQKKEELCAAATAKFRQENFNDLREYWGSNLITPHEGLWFNKDLAV